MGFKEVKPKAPQELIDAEKRLPSNPFVASCREFFDKRGFLSAKQLTALSQAKAHPQCDCYDDELWEADNREWDDFDPFDP